MISSLVSTGDELEFNNAYANIGLIAGKVWAYDQEDPYRKLNQSLWIKHRNLSHEHFENDEKIRRSVRDVIPSSRLAQYGDYEYNDEREKMYKSSVDRSECREKIFNDEKSINAIARKKTNLEPWMNDRVVNYFHKLVSPNSKFSQFFTTDKRSSNRNGNEGTKKSRRRDYRDLAMPEPYTIDDNEQLKLQKKINGKLVRELWNSRKFTISMNDRQVDEKNVERMKNFSSIVVDERFVDGPKFCRKSFSDNRRDRDFVVDDGNLRNDGNFVDSRKTVFPVLRAEVPEFFPKLGKSVCDERDERREPIAFFPSSSERSYQDELFPYNRGRQFSGLATIPQNPVNVPIAITHPTVNTIVQGPHHWIQRLGPPIHIQVPTICTTINHQPIYSTVQPIYPTTMIHRPINVNEKMLSTSPTSIPAPIPVYQRPPELYNDHPPSRRGKNNHGVDFNNLILLTKNAMKARRNQSKNPRQTTSFILESRQPNLKSENDVLEWLDKGYPKRAREFVNVNSLISKLENFPTKCDFANVEMDGKATTSTTTTTTISDEQVGTNFVGTEFRGVDCSVVDCSNVVPIAKKRLYRDVLANCNVDTGAELVLDNYLDKRYDELEKQAIEQYRTSEECLAIRYQELERQALEQYRNSSSSSESIRSMRSSAMCEIKKNNVDEIVNDDEIDVGKNDEQGQERSLGFEKFCGRGLSVDTFSSGVCRGSPMDRQNVIPRPDNDNRSVVEAVRESASENCSLTRSTTITTKSLTALNRANFVRISGNRIKGASGDNTEDRAKRSLNATTSNVKPMAPHDQSIPPTAQTSAIVVNSVISRTAKTDDGTTNGGGDDKIKFSEKPRERQLWLSSFWS